MALSLSRILLSLLFIADGYSKVIGYGGNNMQNWIGTVKGLKIPGTNDPLPNPELLAQIAAYALLAGGIMLFIGILSRVSALGLLLFTIVALVLGHAFWTYAEPVKSFAEMQDFLKGLGIIGGLLMIVAYGGGGASIDAMFRRQPM